MEKSVHAIIVDYLKCHSVIEAVTAILRQDYDQSRVQVTVIDNSCSDENFGVLKKAYQQNVT